MIIRVLNPKRKIKKGAEKMARKRKRKNPRRRRRNPVATGLLAGNPRRKRRHRRNPVATGLLAGNPSRKRRHRKNPARAHYRRRRNPSLLGSSSGILAQLQPMAIGAAGAVALNFALNKIPMGISDKMKPWAKLGAAVVAPMFIKNKAVKLGAFVLRAFAIRDLIVNAVPQLAGGELTPDEISALEGYAAADLEGYDPELLGTNVVYGADTDELLGTNVVYGEDDLMGEYGM